MVISLLQKKNAGKHILNGSGNHGHTPIFALNLATGYVPLKPNFPSLCH